MEVACFSKRWSKLSLHHGVKTYKPITGATPTYKTRTRTSVLLLEIKPLCPGFDVLLTVHLSIFISVINQHDAQNISFTISLFHASTCFEHMCSSSGGQSCITQPSLAQVHETATYRCDDTRGCVMQF